MKRREFLGLAGAALIAAPAVSRAATPNRLRIVVIANRYHEADGLMAAVGNQMKASPNLSLPYNVVWPRAYPADPTLSQKPRCLIDVRKDPSDSTPSATMEIWCIDDIGYTGGSGG